MCSVQYLASGFWNLAGMKTCINIHSFLVTSQLLGITGETIPGDTSPKDASSY